MEAQKITFRCPPDLMAVIEARIQQSGEDKTRVIIDALRYALGVTDLPSDAVVGKSKLLEVLSRLEKIEGDQVRFRELLLK